MLAHSCMPEGIFVGKLVPLFWTEGLPIATVVHLQHSFDGKQLWQEADDSILSGQKHL